MTPIRIFISSAQREFARERKQLRDYLRGDPLMRRFFEVFLFEDVPASDRRPSEVYIDEVERCDIYVGLFGDSYGFEDEHGISPTEREFDRATEREKHRLVFVKSAGEGGRHPKMRALIARTQAGATTRSNDSRSEFNSPRRYPEVWPDYPEDRRDYPRNKADYPRNYPRNGPDYPKDRAGPDPRPPEG